MIKFIPFIGLLFCKVEELGTSNKLLFWHTLMFAAAGYQIGLWIAK